MSAITGILFRDGQNVKPNLIKRMNDQLSHRGPDGSAVWCKGSMALGHQMLCTTPESILEKLPFQDGKTGLVITADARIDNRKELSDMLGIEDKENVSDSYFILKAYEKWGERCPEHLLGDFAFAIWDENEEKLFCARDHMGVKPFYYYLNDEMFIFSTEIKALLSIPKLSFKINKQKISYYLIPIHQDRELTFYKNIFRLPAAELALVTSKKFEKKKFWKLDPHLKIKLSKKEDYYKKFREIFAEAIECRLRSNFPIGFDLSGGIDSTSVIGMAKEILPSQIDLDTFSLIFNEIKESDERFYINSVVQTGRIKPHFIVGDNVSPLKNIENILWYQECPFETPNMAMSWKFYNKIKENQIRIMISGYDGDSVLYKGTSYLNELFISFKWIKLIQEIVGLSRKHGKNIFRISITYVLYPMFLPIIPNFIINLMKSNRKYPQKKRYRLINKKLNKKLNLKRYYKEIVEKPEKKSHYNSRKRHYYYLTLGTHQQNLEDMDKLVGTFEIDYRHPMLDKRLIEFCYAIPTEIKFNKGWGRMLARKGLSELLPKEVQCRTNKSNFGPVLGKYFFEQEKKKLKKLLIENKEIRDYINFKEFKSIYDKYIEDQSIDSLDIWKITILSIWLDLIRHNKNLNIRLD